jgi:putative polyketide hydroxylase
MSSSGDSDCPVLVVGAGPAGLVAAVTLARYGIKVLVVEKRDATSALSRALVISTRSMEIFRAWGLEDQIRAGAADVESRAWVARTLASAEGTEMPLGYPTIAQAAQVSPTRPAWAPQDHLEPLLLALARSLPSAEVRFGCELVALRQDADGVRAGVRSPGSDQVQEIRARFAIGADGAHSAIRSQLGIRMDGPGDLAEYHRVEFTAPLGDIVGERRYGLYVITSPGAAGVLAPRGNSDRWGLSREWTTGQPRLADFSQERLAGLIRSAIGVDTVQPLIERVSTFSFAAQIAQSYRKGRVFLVGDAAHRMTPRGGTGMNTAIQDAYDIGWKIGWVLRGWAEERLLETYEADRRPVGRHNVERAGQPDGARRDAEDALPWDLNGRVAHHWLPRGGTAVSTLDLLGEGLTLFAGPEEPRWDGITAIAGCRPPLAVRCLDATTATALAISPGGACLLRPDGRPVASWPSFTAHVANGGDLAG